MAAVLHRLCREKRMRGHVIPRSLSRCVVRPDGGNEDGRVHPSGTRAPVGAFPTPRPPSVRARIFRGCPTGYPSAVTACSGASRAAAWPRCSSRVSSASRASSGASPSSASCRTSPSRDEFGAMFLDEARLAAQLTHPNIVQIYDFGKADDYYFIAMEYVDGIDLGQLIRRAEERPVPSSWPRASSPTPAPACTTRTTPSTARPPARHRAPRRLAAERARQLRRRGQARRLRHRQGAVAAGRTRPGRGQGQVRVHVARAGRGRAARRAQRRVLRRHLPLRAAHRRAAVPPRRRRRRRCARSATASRSCPRSIARTCPRSW